MNNILLNDMENYIVNKQSVTLVELCDHFNICMNTVRKYTNILVQKPYITKFYGGVCVNDSACTFIFTETRSSSNPDEKKLIAKKAASLICQDDIVFIDSGTTTRYIPQYIPEHINCTIISHSFYIIESCIQMPNITIIALPGIFYTRSYSFVDSYSTNYLKSLNFQKAFMGCTGFSLESGATNSTPLETFIKNTAVGIANKVYLLADHSKIGLSSLLTYATTDQITDLITDCAIPDEYQTTFNQLNHKIILS